MARPEPVVCLGRVVQLEDARECRPSRIPVAPLEGLLAPSQYFGGSLVGHVTNTVRDSAKNLPVLGAGARGVKLDPSGVSPKSVPRGGKLDQRGLSDDERLA